jgi:hypothetical protein
LVVTALKEADIRLPAGDGINIWLPVADEQAALISLASAGITAAAGKSFQVGPGTPHLRVTVGLIASEHAEVAAHLAQAARVSAHGITR